jgi:predicted O-linked N-acetylglucosamine transferase (SPINDLY family)
MNAESFAPTSLDNEDTLRQQADRQLNEANYSQAIDLYGQLIAAHPNEIPLYWQLGLAQLLQGLEADAQVTWMTPLLEADIEQQEQWTAELAATLQAAAQQQEAIAAYEQAWLIRQYLQEFAPHDWDNRLQTLWLALKTQMFDFEQDSFTQILETLRQNHSETAEIGERLLSIAQQLLEQAPGHAGTLAFLEACTPCLTDSQTMAFIHLLFSHAESWYEQSKLHISAPLDRLLAKLVFNDFDTLIKVVFRLQHGSSSDLLESIRLAEHCVTLAQTLSQRITATNAVLSGWIGSGGSWQRSQELYQEYKNLLIQLVESQTTSPTLVHSQASSEASPETELGFLAGLAGIGSLFFYFEDHPQTNRPLRNQIAQIAQAHLQSTLKEEVQRYQTRSPLLLIDADRKRTPRIGYFAGTLRQHSVGWLCRWLLKYHDRSRFDIHLYSPRPSNDFIQNGFRQDYGDRFHDVSSYISSIANQIYEDQIDILVELDSLTNFGSCGIVALKPAPIQVHWLGYDASGIPGVDYFIVDPYVVPEDAQNYYREMLWRLPQTYIAVDGFETHLPSLRRDQLEIPGDAIVYLSSQTGMKRNIDNVRLQMRVIKEVPNSYFLIKSFKANPEFIQTFFRDLAESEGVSADRLRFLPDVASEFVHRANLAIADVVLDTFPYNGATTTLEALWTGLPIVTRVGEQFAARNSYTMMMNAGITEGIAWSDEEYLDWGIRLGTDASLRQDIFYRLKRSRHTAPLWNAKQFTLEMEKAYQQMWERYTQ